jgi:tripartite-type tricarboxylate transporter receptor subunit TctC
MNALLAGEVDFTSQSPSVARPHVVGGKVRALATTGNQRTATFPDVPTLMERGIDAEYVFWAGLFAPAGTPREILATLRAATRQAVEDAGFLAAMSAMGTPVHHLDGAAFDGFVTSETERLGAVVRRVGKLE